MPAVPLARRPMAVLRFYERLLALLDRAGMDDRTAVLSLQAVTAWLRGYLLVELRAMVDNREEPEPALRLGLRLMLAQDSPGCVPSRPVSPSTEGRGRRPGRPARPACHGHLAAEVRSIGRRRGVHRHDTEIPEEQLGVVRPQSYCARPAERARGGVLAREDCLPVDVQSEQH